MPRVPKVVEYNKMKAPELKKLCEQRDIRCRPLIKDMVEALRLEEQGKWVFHTEQEKLKRGGYLIKIDYRNKEDLIRMGTLIEKKMSKRLDTYSMCRIWFKMDEEFIKT